MSKAGAIPASVLQEAQAEGQKMQSQGIQFDGKQVLPAEDYKHNAPTKSDLQHLANGTKPPETVQEVGKTMNEGGVTQSGELPGRDQGTLQSKKQHELAPKPPASESYGGVKQTPSNAPQATAGQPSTETTQPKSQDPQQQAAARANPPSSSQPAAQPAQQQVPEASQQPSATEQYGQVSQQPEPSPQPQSQPEMGG